MKKAGKELKAPHKSLLERTLPVIVDVKSIKISKFLEKIGEKSEKRKNPV